MIKKVLTKIVDIILLIGTVLLIKVLFFPSKEARRIPELSDRWWAGYYDKTPDEKQWCVAYFIEKPTGEIRMALLSAKGDPDIFKVGRDSSDKNFIQFDMSGPGGIKITAEQLYLGKRYGFQRLIGRPKDLWKKNIIIDFIRKNEDCAIRGELDWGSRARLMDE
jgi:hypothetical protein